MAYYSLSPIDYLRINFSDFRSNHIRPRRPRSSQTNSISAEDCGTSKSKAAGVQSMSPEYFRLKGRPEMRNPAPERGSFGFKATPWVLIFASSRYCPSGKVRSFRHDAA